MWTPGSWISRLLAGGVFVVLLGLVATAAAPQAWRAEKARLEAEAAKLFEKARQEGATDIADFEAEFTRLQAEYLEKVVKPALSGARTCAERMEAVEIAISLERQAQILGTSFFESGQLTGLLTGPYGDQAFERCMNELYRACVVEDNPLYTLTMTAWVLGYERQKQLLGASSDTETDLTGELDPRITRCRGPWYQVRIVVEDSGTEPDTGPWKNSDISEGWLGRGLTQRRAGRAAAGPHPGDFERRAEQMSYAARCPDGGCDGVCGFTAVASGRSRVDYGGENQHDGGRYRSFSLGFREGAYTERIERNACPHKDLPIAFHPGETFTVLFPPDIVTPLTEPRESLPTGADPRVTEAMDEWARMFQPGTVELLDEWEQPLGRLEVRRVCDGRELWGQGPAECQQKWQEYLKLFGSQVPLAPWERKLLSS